MEPAPIQNRITEESGITPQVWVQWFNKLINTITELEGDVGTEVSAYGELLIAHVSPIVQIKSIYGIRDNVSITTILSGTAAINDNMFEVKTGTAVNAFGAIIAVRPIIYKAGQGALCRISAKFDQGVADFRSGAGFFSGSDVLTFGYEGTEFGITYNHGGVNPVYSLDLAAGASGNETATVTIEGTAQNVAITSGTAQKNAAELAGALQALFPLWRFDQINGSVVFSKILNGAVSGTFSYSSTGTSAGTMTSTVTGVTTTRNIIPKTQWNRDKMPSLKPQKLNTYQIRFQFLGSGSIQFFVEDSKSGRFTLVHIIEYANSSEIPSMANPSMLVGWNASSAGSTTNLGLSGASVLGAREGVEASTAREGSANVTHSAVSTTEQTHLVIRGRRTFGGKTNRGAIEPFNLSVANDGNKAVTIRGYKNCSITGITNFQYTDEINSIAVLDNTQNTIDTDCNPFITLTIPKGGSEVLDMTGFSVEALAQDDLVFTSQVVSGAAVEVSMSIIWREDI